MGYVVDRMGCGVFMMLVENHGSLQFSYHLKILAFMCRMQWDVKDIWLSQTDLLIQY